MKSLTGLYKYFGLDAPLQDDFPEVFDSGDMAKSVSSAKAGGTETITQTYSYFRSYRDGIDFTHYDEALQLARDYLEGWYGDYIFFQDAASTSSTADYVLIKGDCDIQGNVLTVSGSGLLIRYSNASSNMSSSYSRNYNVNLSEVGQNNSAITGTVSGTQGYFAYLTDKVTITRRYAIFEDYEFTLGSDDFYYSSLPDTPHLIEGVQNYAFAAFLLAAAVITFNLIDRVFRRVY